MVTSLGDLPCTRHIVDGDSTRGDEVAASEFTCERRCLTPASSRPQHNTPDAVHVPRSGPQLCTLVSRWPGHLATLPSPWSSRQAAVKLAAWEAVDPAARQAPTPGKGRLLSRALPLTAAGGTRTGDFQVLLRLVHAKSEPQRERPSEERNPCSCSMPRHTGETWPL